MASREEVGHWRAVPLKITAEPRLFLLCLLAFSLFATSSGHQGRGTLTQKMSPEDWPVGKSLGHFLG